MFIKKNYEFGTQTGSAAAQQPSTLRCGFSMPIDSAARWSSVSRSFGFWLVLLTCHKCLGWSMKGYSSTTWLMRLYRPRGVCRSTEAGITFSSSWRSFSGADDNRQTFSRARKRLSSAPENDRPGERSPGERSPGGGRFEEPENENPKVQPLSQYAALPTTKPSRAGYLSRSLLLKNATSSH